MLGSQAQRIPSQPSSLEIPEPLQTVGAATGVDPQLLVLTGGEDHALAATFPPGRAPAGWSVIGTVAEAPQDGPVVLVDGEPFAGVPGFDHFRPGARR